MADSSAKSGVTPMMRQYLDIRADLPPNTLLLFRLGDFYEMFHEDAEIGAGILGITLTRRSDYPMAGIPYHAFDNYVGKILAAGKKVAIVEQTETPQPGKLVKRELTRILTPGTTLEDHQNDARRNNFILALSCDKQGLHAAWLDVTTGEFVVASEKDPTVMLSAFTALDPREIVVPEAQSKNWSQKAETQLWAELFSSFAENRPISTLPDYAFECDSGAQSVMQTLSVLNLEGFGLDKHFHGLGPAGAVIQYATENLCAKPENLRQITRYSAGKTLLLDPSTQRNLEIFRSALGTREGSLLSAMDATSTTPGARLLEQFLSAPTLDLEELQRRQNCVGEFLEAPGYASELREYLRCLRDIPRVLGRLQNRLRNPRELGAIRDSLQQFPLIMQVLEQYDGPAIGGLLDRIQDFPDLRDLLEKSLQDELPSDLLEGGYIRDGYDEELDHLRSLTRDVKTWISDLEKSEQTRTGIKNLRIKYNNAFGYFIEVTKSNIHLVPEDYTRKQTMTNAERYYTEDLKTKEKEILHADEKAIAREETMFRELVAQVLAVAEELKDVATALAEIDVFLGWAQIAREWDYCKPTLDHSDLLEINDGRHPIVEQMMRKERYGLAGTRSFVPNSTYLTADDEQIALITGPNMAGKSTYIRQVSLITLMAQVGSWVPAASCHIGLVDKIFSRVGASDELAKGNSTFMVEMNETANIINNCTSRSLIILDEIGRGTSTYDGLSIAWAVVEHLHGEGERGPRTLFATHYHELTQLEHRLPRLRNYCVAVKEWNDEIIFVRQVIKGAADRSYGIQVARLAGLPHSIIDRAKTILSRLEDDDSSHNIIRKQMNRVRKSDQPIDSNQLSLF